MAIPIPTSPAGVIEAQARVIPKSSKMRGRLMLTCLGPKGTGKTTNISTIPKRADQKHYFLTADSNTMDGLIKFWSKRLGSVQKAEEYVDANFVVFDLTELYDPSDPETSKMAARHVHKIFRQVKADGETGVICSLSIEHYDVLFSRLGIDLCRAEYNIPKDQKVPFQQYDERGQFLDPVDAFIETIKCDVLCLVGYGEEDKEKLVPSGRKKKRKNPKTGEIEEVDETEVRIIKAMPRWIVKRLLSRNSKARIDFERVRNEKELVDGTKVFTDHYIATVIDSTHERFDIGMSLDVTNKGLAPFFEGGWWPIVSR